VKPVTLVGIALIRGADMSLTTGVEHERDRHPLGAHAVARDAAAGMGA
jgi:hypothetical protein